MRDIALYYPTMNVPSGSWLTQTLLYWDQVASIVPEAMQPELMKDPFTNRLVELGQLVMIDPSEALSKPGVEEKIHEAFGVLGELNLRTDEGHRIDSQMRSEKMLYSIRSRLERSGHAQSSDGLDSWIRVERGVAGWYMSLLAGVIAGNFEAENRDLVVRPVTQNETDLTEFLGPITNKDAGRYLCKVIHEVLPSPQGSLDPVQIADFKNAHGDELRRLRNWIDKKILEGSQYEGEQLSLWTRTFRFEAAEEINALTEAMRRRRWPKIVLVGIGGIVASGLALANDLVTGIDGLSIGLTVGSSAFNLASAGMSLAELTNARTYDGRAPLAYAALTAKNLR